MYEINQSTVLQTILQDVSFQNIFVNNEKIDKIGLNYYRYMIQPLVLNILRCFFKKCQQQKISPPVGLLLVL